MSPSFDANLARLGAEVPGPSVPGANYVPYVISGNQVHLTGQIPKRGSEVEFVGKVGSTLKPEEAYKAARLCGLNLIVHLRDACGGSLSRVRRIVKVTGYVNCTPDFIEIAQVINGASDLFVEIFGEAGRHARCALGLASLPRGVGVEVEAIAEIA